MFENKVLLMCIIEGAMTIANFIIAYIAPRKNRDFCFPSVLCSLFPKSDFC